MKRAIPGRSGDDLGHFNDPATYAAKSGRLRPYCEPWLDLTPAEWLSESRDSPDRPGLGTRLPGESQ